MGSSPLSALHKKSVFAWLVSDPLPLLLMLRPVGLALRCGSPPVPGGERIVDFARLTLPLTEGESREAAGVAHTPSENPLGQSQSGSTAEKAGLKPGDVIISVDGRDIKTPADFSREMRNKRG